MFIVNRYYRKYGKMNHSSEFFDISSEVVELPQNVKNRVYAICDADGNDSAIDYALCQAVDEKGGVWRTELIKAMPST